MFRSAWLPELFARTFAPIPDVPIWQWAEGPPAPFRIRQGPEPTYRSKRTPWTRRGSDLIRCPWDSHRRIRRCAIRKSSQSGFSEGLMLNPIRWTAKHRPRNCLVSLDSQKEVDNMRERLLPTLLDLGQQIFTDDHDDLGKLKLTLRGMVVYFTGAGNASGQANKYTPWVFNDEVDLYAEVGDEGDSLENFFTRAKQAEFDGFQVAMSKPACADGPIDTLFKRGNQEYWNVPCPHCQEMQPLEWERVEFQHCKDLVGAWDKERVLAETFYRCRKCGQPIHDHGEAGLARKQWMNDRGLWVPTAKGEPEIVSQQMSDLYSTLSGSRLGHLALEYIAAEEADSRRLRMSFRQQRLGLPWVDKIVDVAAADVLRLRDTYRRGIIPVAGCKLAIGMDIGLYVNTRWIVYAFNRAGEMWLIDWGGHGDPRAGIAPSTGPADVIAVMRTRRYTCTATGAAQPIDVAFLDARYRSDEVYETCLLAPRQIFPVIGLQGRAARSIAYRQVPNRPPGFAQLEFINQDAMFDLYSDRIKDLKPPGLHWPSDLEQILIAEHSAERMIRHPRTNRVIWEDKHSRPNHYGDATKIALTGIDWLTHGKRSRVLSDATTAREEVPTLAPAI